MVFDRIKNMFSDNKEKYEILYYKYSQVKLENQRLKQKYTKDKDRYKEKVDEKVIDSLIKFYRVVDGAKNDTFKISVVNSDMQKLVLDINKIHKSAKDVLFDFSLREFIAKEKYFDPKLHQIASYASNDKLKKGTIVKTAKPGIKYKATIIEKPKVVVVK